MIHEAFFSDLVILTDDQTSTWRIGSLEDAIMMNDSIFSQVRTDSFDDRVQFGDAISKAEYCTFNLTLSDILTLIDEATPRTHLETMSDQLYVFDWMEIPNGLLYDTLDFVETMTGISSYDLPDSLAFEDTLAFIKTLNLQLQDSLALQDGLGGYVDDPWRPIFPIVEEVA